MGRIGVEMHNIVGERIRMVAPNLLFEAEFATLGRGVVGVKDGGNVLRLLAGGER